MAEFKDLKKFISENTEQVSAILDSERLSIVNAPEVKLLHGKFLIEFWKARPNKKITFAVFFDEDQIEHLNFDTIKNNLNTVITEQLKTDNLIEVESEFNIISYQTADFSHNFLQDLSNKQKVVFFFGEEGIDIVARGKLIDKINFFYNESDRMMFYRKFHISKLQDCLKEYEVFIKEPGVNEAFFASLVTVTKIQPTKTPNNTLHNKPENILRNNLLSFLNRNTQHTFSKENELNNKRELDLYTEVEGKKYLIEVKWLGQSLNDDDTGFTQKVTDVSAREGVTQTLEYIKHLFEEMNFTIHSGFLCVFDARETKKPVNYDSFKFVTADLMPYYTRHFIKLDEIPLSRNT